MKVSPSFPVASRLTSAWSGLARAATVAVALSGCSGETPSATLAASVDQLTEGVWAKQMILASESSAVGIRSTSKIERLILVKMTKHDDLLETTEELCDIRTTASNGATLAFPDAFRRLLSPRQASYQLHAGAAGAQVVGGRVVELLGARLRDEVRGALPTSDDDPAVVDQDADGHPGVTVEVSARALFVTVEGKVYLTQRTITQETGTLQSADLIRGKIDWSFEQKVLGSDSRILSSVSPSTTVLPEQSEFTMRKLGDGDTCASMLRQYDRLFVRP
jgi:hypothetical protein